MAENERWMGKKWVQNIQLEMERKVWKKKCDESAFIFRLISKCEINRHRALRMVKMEKLRYEMWAVMCSKQMKTAFFFRLKSRKWFLFFSIHRIWPMFHWLLSYAKAKITTVISKEIRRFSCHIFKRVDTLIQTKQQSKEILLKYWKQ